MDDGVAGPPAPEVTRVATGDDVAEVARLVAMMFGTIGVTGDGAAWLAAVGSAVTDGPGAPAVVLVVDDPSVPGRLAAVGAGVINVRFPSPAGPVGRAGYLQWMATDPSQRRRGCATLIVRDLLAWFVDHGVTKVDLHATPVGESVYRAAGFTEGSNPGLRWRLLR